jgi:hypothetical protein
MKKFYSVLALMLMAFTVFPQQIDRNLVLMEIGTATW